MAFVIGVWRLGAPSLWRDEVSTIVAARRPWESLFGMLSEVDAVHGLYFVVMKLWTSVVGTGSIDVRLPSAVAVAATAVLVVLIGSLLADDHGRSVGVFAGLALAVLPRTTWLAVEARSYAIAMFLVTLTAYLLLRALRSTGRLPWVWYGIAAVVSVVMFLHSAVVLLAVGIGILALRPGRQALIRFAVATTAAVLAVVPFVAMFINQRAMVSWLQPATWSDAAAALVQVPFDTVTAAAALGWGLALLGLVQLVRGGATADDPDRGRGTAVLVGLWAVLPTVLLVGVSLAGLSVYTPRYLAGTVPGVALAIGFGLAALRPRLAAVVLVVVLALVAAPNWQAQRADGAKGPWRQMAAELRSSVAPGDGVLYVTYSPTAGTSRIIPYAYPTAIPPGTVDLTIDEPVARTRHLWETSLPLAETTGRLAGVDRVWVVGATDRNPRTLTDLATLEAEGFAPVDTRAFSSGFEITQYERA
ncbi:glycosyltransferase family 39 protein [Propionibacteriaceae bacterium Y2011]